MKQQIEELIKEAEERINSHTANDAIWFLTDMKQIGDYIESERDEFRKVLSRLKEIAKHKSNK